MKNQLRATVFVSLVALSALSACALVAGIQDDTVNANLCSDPALGMPVPCDGGATGSGGKSAGSGGATSTSSASSGSGGAMPITCDDGKRDNGETGTDCGGGLCKACPVGGGCDTGTDCLTLSCPAHTCVAATCTDQIANEDETDVDCGGLTCKACATMMACLVGGDCETGSCVGKVCRAATCKDGVKNEDETGPDCGGTTCPACANGVTCQISTDCASLYCPTPGSACAPWAKAIAAGADTACAVTPGGGVKCWGSNNVGQVGNDSAPTPALDPVDTTPTTAVSSISAVSIGNEVACDIQMGGVNCWGDNSSGEIGLNAGTAGYVMTPSGVVGALTDVVSISVGGETVCVITTSGGAQCWGYNGDGELGGSTLNFSNTPLDVNGLTSGVATISVGAKHVCAVTKAGGVKCWGSNASGQIGLPSTTTTTGNPATSYFPVDVASLTSGVATVSSGGQHTCAVTIAGGVKCWGDDGVGQLGNNSNTLSTSPVDVVGLTSGVAAVSAGNSHTCALTKAGGVKCWGDNRGGELGSGTTGLNSGVPVDITGLTSGVAAIAAGSSFTCALTTAGGVACWGSLPGQPSSASPVLVPTFVKER